MAQSPFGAEYAKFATYATPETETTAAVYDTPFSLGGLVSATETPNVSTGQLYSDNKETLRKDTTTSYAITLTTDGMANKDKAALLGADYDGTSDQIAYDNSDVQPYGGFGYIRNVATEDDEYWKGVFYPKCKAAPTADGADTQGSNITFGTFSISLTALRSKHTNTKFRYDSKNFTSEEEAKAWVDGRFTANP